MKAFEITLPSSGEVVTMREPRTDELPAFLRAMPALTALGKAMENQDVPGVMLPVNLSDSDLDMLYPLLAKLAGIEETDVRAMSLWDGMALLMGMQELIPSDFLQLRPKNSAT